MDPEGLQVELCEQPGREGALCFLGGLWWAGLLVEGVEQGTNCPRPQPSASGPRPRRKVSAPVRSRKALASLQRARIWLWCLAPSRSDCTTS